MHGACERLIESLWKALRTYTRVYPAASQDGIVTAERRPGCSMHFCNERRNAARILDQHCDARGLTFLSIPRLTLMRRLWRRISISILYARTDNSLGERVNCADLCSPVRRRVSSSWRYKTNKSILDRNVMRKSMPA